MSVIRSDTELLFAVSPTDMVTAPSSTSSRPGSSILITRITSRTSCPVMGTAPLAGNSDNSLYSTVSQSPLKPRRFMCSEVSRISNSYPRLVNMSLSPVNVAISEASMGEKEVASRAVFITVTRSPVVVLPEVEAAVMTTESSIVPPIRSSITISSVTSVMSRPV